MEIGILLLLHNNPITRVKAEAAKITRKLIMDSSSRCRTLIVRHNTKIR